MTAKYWILNAGSNVKENRFTLTIRAHDTDLPVWHETKVVFLVKAGKIDAVCRVARLRKNLLATEVLLDRRIKALSEWEADWQQLGLDLHLPKVLYAVTDASLAEQFLASHLPNSLENMSPFAGEPELEIQRYIRELAVMAFEDDVLGPADGPHEEIVDVSVRDRYLVGRLPPRNTFLPTGSDLDLDEDEKDEDQIPSLSNQVDPDAAQRKQTQKVMLQPSSFGLSFMVGIDTNQVTIRAGWGRYLKRKEPEAADNKTVDVWVRTPHEVTCDVILDPGEKEFELLSGKGVNIKQVVRQVGDKKIVSMFLENRIEHTGENTAPDDKWIFQPYLRVFDRDHQSVFLSRSITETYERDIELQQLDMLYRDECEFAIGHGVSVHADTGGNKRRAVSVETRIVPRYEVPFTETPGTEEEDRESLRGLVSNNALDMVLIADQATPSRKHELIETLNVLADDYASWIEEQKLRAESEPEIVGSAKYAMARCNIALRRLREGIKTLDNDPVALKAFSFANRAMAQQRVRSKLIAHNQTQLGASATGQMDHSDDDALVSQYMSKPSNHSWRAFQLAFFLLILPSLADPTHPQRTEEASVGDLLWFPTGGGKTEAYLGAAAFAMAVRRLQKSQLLSLDSSRGLAVIMRYTLRLLTLQQFQRASTLICAMEMLRRNDPETWGETPFTIGLWVGFQSTPNTIQRAAQMIREAKRRGGDEAPFQVTRCPWCGEPLRLGSNARADEDTLRLHIHCSNHRCEFSEILDPDGLPLKVIDEEIYRRPPSMLIATVDKFAQMPLKGDIRTLFGLAEKECPRHGLVLPDCDCHKSHKADGSMQEVFIKKISRIRPPDLIIQDEFHLISGPLGTMVGLYETAIDELCSWKIVRDSKTLTVHPKVIASTATVRKAADQMRNVFCRNMEIFPPGGLDAADNFFSVQRSLGKHPGRLYLGLCAPGSAKPPVMIRMYVTLLTVAKDLYSRFGALADPYMSLVGYFSSLRELGGMKRLTEDDVRTRCGKIKGDKRPTYRAGMENRNLKPTQELTSRVRNYEIPHRLDLMARPWSPDQPSSPDIVLATNMLSVGVDVDRLGLMAVNGQPKNTAEYIQATSRVGRRYPGLVCTVYAWGRPRDLSHYETFEHYHATFYKHVEAQSVTPFSSRALDKGLNGALVSCVRLGNDQFSPEKGADLISTTGANFEVSEAVDVFFRRSWEVTLKREVGREVKSRVEDALNEWENFARDVDSELVYTNEKKSDRPKKLLRTDDLINSTGEWLVPSSMREVEPPVCLILDNQQIKAATSFPWPEKSRKQVEKQTHKDRRCSTNKKTRIR